MKYLTRSFFYSLCPLVKLLLGFSWMGMGGLFLNVALFVGAQYSEQNQSMANNEKTFYVVSYNDEPCLEMAYLQCWSENFLLWMGVGGGEIRTCITCCLRDIKVMETAKQSSIYKSK